MAVVLQAYYKGFLTLLRSKRIWFFQLFVNLALAYLLSFPLKKLLSRTIGNSLDLERSIGKFDYTVLNDFLQNYGVGIDSLKDQSLIALAFYFILLVFFNAGIAHVVQRYPGAYRFREFLTGGSAYFWKFLRLSIYFLILYFFLIFVGFKIVTIEGVSPFNMESEVGLISRAKIVISILVLLFFLLASLHDIIKITITKSKGNYITSSIAGGFSIFRKHFFKFLCLAALHVLLAVIFWFLYLGFKKLCNGGACPIFIIFLVGQLYILSRIAMRIWKLSSFYQLILRA